MQTETNKVWFRAKKYGWGWGAPCSWQGWITLLLYVALVIVGAALLVQSGRMNIGAWIGYMGILTLAFLAVCFAKGEQPRWRWGEEDRPPSQSAATRLTDLDQLRRQGLISDPEYQAKRQEILRQQ